MSYVCFHKTNGQWASLADDALPPGDINEWVINPVFVDQARCMMLGPKYWKYNDNEISCMTDEEIDNSPEFVVDAKDEVTNNITSFRENSVLLRGFNYMGHVIDTREKDRTNIIGVCTAALSALLTGGSMPPGFAYRAHDNVEIQMNAQQVVGMGLAMLTFIQTCYGASWYHKAQVEALTTKTAVDSYDYKSAGWPPVLSEYGDPSNYE